MPGCLFLHPEPLAEARPAKRRRLQSDVPHEGLLSAERARIAEERSQKSQQVTARDRISKTVTPLSKSSVDLAPSASNHVAQQPPAIKQTSTAIAELKVSPIDNKSAESAKTLQKPSDQRYISRATSTAEITIRFDPLCKISHESRLHYLRLYKKQFERIYAAFDNEVYEKLTHDHAIEQEKLVVSKNSKGTYKQASRNALIGLTKRELALNQTDIGIHPTYKPPIKKLEKWTTMVHSKKTLTAWGYTTDIPDPDSTQSDEENCDRICDRCNQRFIVTKDPSRWLSCTYHPGKSTYKTDHGVRTTSWTCCNLSSTSTITGDSNVAGCETSPTHVFKINHAPRLAAYNRYQLLPLSDSQHPDMKEVEIAAVDCEMVYTTASLELARVSVTLPDNSPLLDFHVMPDHPILDYNTRYSGITAKSLASDPSTVKMSQLVEKLSAVGITRDTILVGHGLENDLTAMRLIHHNVIDSAILFPHPRGRPYRNALKYLVKRYLNKDIQMNLANAKPVGADGGEVAEGHDSLEDARAAMELVIWKMSHGDEKVGDTPFAGKLK